MLTEFRAAVHDLLVAQLPALLGSGIEIFHEVPDDVNAAPCIVVGRPAARETATRVVFDLTTEVHVIGRKQTADNPEVELTTWADAVWTALRGTRATNQNQWSLQAQGIVPRNVFIAGVEHPAYVVVVSSSLATC